MSSAIAVLVKLLTLLRLPPGPLRGIFPMQVPPLAGSRVVDRDEAELPRPGGDEAPEGSSMAASERVG